MFPSSESIAEANTFLNVMVADVLNEFANRLETAEDTQKEMEAIVKETYLNHKRIIFNGNGYSNEWVEEAARRGLSNYKTTVDVLPCFIKEDSIALFERNQIFHRSELFARYEILLEEYYKTLNIEARTMLDMVQKQIMPATLQYTTQIAEHIIALNKVGVFEVNAQTELLQSLTTAINTLKQCTDQLHQELEQSTHIEEAYDKAVFFKEHILVDMEALRQVADELELLIDEKAWPIPTYGELLFRA